MADKLEQSQDSNVYSDDVEQLKTEESIGQLDKDINNSNNEYLHDSDTLEHVDDEINNEEGINDIESKDNEIIQKEETNEVEDQPTDDVTKNEDSNPVTEEPEEASKEAEVPTVVKEGEYMQIEAPVIESEILEERDIQSTTSIPSTESKKAGGLNLNVLNTTNKDISEGNLKEVESVITHEISVGDMTSVDSYEEPSVFIKRHGLKSVVKDNNKWYSISKTPRPNSEELKEVTDKLLATKDKRLLLSRLEENKNALDLQSPKDKESLLLGNETLKKTFHEVKTGVEYTHNEELINNIDWEFWSSVVNDYGNVVLKRENELIDHISTGIPQELRGLVWQIICESKSIKTEDFFMNSKNEISLYEKQIRRDLSRTSFVTTSLKSQIEDLFQIVKTYSLFDTEVGYTQGMAFLTVPLLLNMEASEAFCLLVKLMFTYGFRDFYLPEMPGLRLRMYQLDRLIDDRIPELSHHFKREGIKSSMYATQWFLTLFAYKFPLMLVLRIFDVVIAEGLESILQFSLNLLIQNKDTLLTMKFEGLVEFLKEKIFHCYLLEDDIYDIDRFVIDAMRIDILPISLDKYTSELEEIDKLENEKGKEIKDLRVKNGQLTRQIREIETAYSILNRDHVEITNEMVKGKLKIGSLEEDKANLQDQIDELNLRLESLKSDAGTTVDFSGPISGGIDLEIQKAMERNLQVMEQNMKLEEELAKLEEENSRLKQVHHSGRTVFGLKTPGKFW